MISERPSSRLIKTPNESKLNNYSDQKGLIQFSNLLMPAAMSEETRRQHLKDNLNRMWRKSVEDSNKSERKTVGSNSRPVSRAAELMEKRSRRRPIETIRYLENMQLKNTKGDIKGTGSKTGAIDLGTFSSKKDALEKKQALIATPADINYYDKESPLQYLPKNTNRVLVQKIIQPRKKRLGSEIAAYTRNQTMMSFDDIESSIKDMLKKSQQRQPSSHVLVDSGTMTHQNFRTDLVQSTESFSATTSEPVGLLAKRHVHKRHKFIQSCAIIMTNSSCQTDPVEPPPPQIIVVESKQRAEVDDLTKTNMEDTIGKLNVQIDDSFKEENKGDDADSKSVVSVDSNGKKKDYRKKDNSIVISSSSSKGFKSNFSDKLRIKTPDAILPKIEELRIESPKPPAPAPQKSSQNAIPKSLIQEVLETPKPVTPAKQIETENDLEEPMQVIEEEEAAEQLEQEEEEEVDNEIATSAPVSRARTAPADITPPKSILKKRPDYSKQMSFSSDGTGTPGYAKTYRKTKELHIDPTLFKHFGESSNFNTAPRRLSFSAAARKQRPKTGSTSRATAGYSASTKDDNNEKYNAAYNDQLHAEQAQYYNEAYSPEYSDPQYQEQVQYQQPNIHDMYYQQQNQYAVPDYNQQQQQYYDYYNYQQPQQVYYEQEIQQQQQFYPPQYYSSYSSPQLIPEYEYDPYAYGIPQDPYYYNQEPIEFKSKEPTKSRKVTVPKPFNFTNRKRVKSKAPESNKGKLYIPLSQTKPEKTYQTNSKKSNQLNSKPRFTTHVSDNAIRVHAKDTLSRNPRGSLRQLYADSSSQNQLEILSNELYY